MSPTSQYHIASETTPLLTNKRKLNVVLMLLGGVSEVEPGFTYSRWVPTLAKKLVYTISLTWFALHRAKRKLLLALNLGVEGGG